MARRSLRARQTVENEINSCSDVYLEGMPTNLRMKDKFGAFQEVKVPDGDYAIGFVQCRVVFVV